MKEFKEKKLEDSPVIEERPSFLRVHLNKKSNSQPVRCSNSGYEILEVSLAIALVLITGYLGYSYVATGPFSFPHVDNNRDAARL